MFYVEWNVDHNADVSIYYLGPATYIYKVLCIYLHNICRKHATIQLWQDVTGQRHPWHHWNPPGMKVLIKRRKIWSTRNLCVHYEISSFRSKVTYYTDKFKIDSSNFVDFNR